MGKRKRSPERPSPTQPHATASEIIVAAAARVAEEVGVGAVLLYADGLDRPDAARDLVRRGLRLVLVVRNGSSPPPGWDLDVQVVSVPAVRLSRQDQLKMAILFAVSQRLLAPDERFIGLVGWTGRPIDCLMLMRAGREWQVLESAGRPDLFEDIRPAVFQRVLQLSLSLAASGREGKPVGVLLVLGDTEHVSGYASQMILNPFHGYSGAQRDIMDDSLVETFREFAILDGAFLVRGNGQIEAAGVYLRPAVSGEALPPGLGARHATAAAITATARCIAITISESNGMVRVWRQGRRVIEIGPREGPFVEEIDPGPG